MMYEEAKKKYWQAIIAKALDRAGDDPRELLSDIRDGVLSEIIEASSLEYVKELAAAWREVLRRFADDSGSAE